MEAGAGRPTCGGGMWRHGAVREEEGLRTELFKRQKKLREKVGEGGAELKKRKGKNKIGEGYFRIYLMF